MTNGKLLFNFCAVGGLLFVYNHSHPDLAIGLALIMLTLSIILEYTSTRLADNCIGVLEIQSDLIDALQKKLDARDTK